ncbi:MAG: pseudaminic acid synthase [Candidatus Nanopelagicales bacterium]|nr:pseudaminic acid synthase [Candidatus Nanopelagicales bacterium]MDZ4248938.1 pseudaminic acid synthase [Candidatus Nanopelagicales bacterium]
MSEIGRRQTTETEDPPLIVAEISANHNGSKKCFLDLIRAAADSGADLVKFQTYTADTMTLPLDTPRFRISDDHGLWGGMRLYDLYEAAHTPWEWHAEGFELARSLGIDAFSSPFDKTAIDFLEQFGPFAYKIASMEISDLPLISYAAGLGKPIVISSGTAHTSEVARAVEVARSAGSRDITLLLCTSSYPASPEDANLVTLEAWREAFGVKTGLSDHTLGLGTSIAAVALGARLIERHVTISRAEGGFDSAFSLEPHELAQLVSECRDAWLALGSVRTGPTKSESESLRLRRSLNVAADVRAGDAVTDSVVRAVRPGGGLGPGSLADILGRRFAVDVSAGTPMSWDLLSPRDSGPVPQMDAAT